MAFSVNDAVNVGMIQKLINPDVSPEWFVEIVKNEFGENLDERTISTVKNQILHNLNSQAITLAHNLEDEKTREIWTSKVRENTERIAEMRKVALAKSMEIVNEQPKWFDDMYKHFANLDH